MSDNEFKYQVRKDINTARTLAYWSMTGLLIPLLGWILGSIALSKSKSVPQDGLDDQLATVNKGTKKLARIALILSTIVFVVMTIVSVWLNLQAIESAKQQSAEAAKQQTVLDKENCLSKAAELDTPVRAQNAGESFVDYMNYTSSVNSAGGAAREACFEKYGQ